MFPQNLISLQNILISTALLLSSSTILADEPIIPPFSQVDFTDDSMLTVDDLNEMGEAGNYVEGVAVNLENDEYDLNGDMVLNQTDIDIMLDAIEYYFHNPPEFPNQPATHEPVPFIIREGDNNGDQKIITDPYINPLINDLIQWRIGASNSPWGVNHNEKWSRGDINFDGLVNFDDFVFVTAQFFPVEPPCPDDLGGPYIDDDPFGDFNGDQEVDLLDLDLICDSIATETRNPIFDLNESGEVDLADVELLRTIISAFHFDPAEETFRPLYLGDTNADGYVNGLDMVTVQLNLNQPGNWSDGDFDCNGIVNFADYVHVLTNLMKDVFTDYP